LLNSIIANPDQKISELEIIGLEEKEFLLNGINETSSLFPVQKDLVKLFEEQAQSTPDKIAVAFNEHHLTYNELNRKANQLSHYLKNIGAGPEKLAGIYMNRGIDMIVGLLGILKSGSGKFLRSIFPFAFSGNSGRITICEGTMYSGSKSFR